MHLENVLSKIVTANKILSGMCKKKIPDFFQMQKSFLIHMISVCKHQYLYFTYAIFYSILKFSFAILQK